MSIRFDRANSQLQKAIGNIIQNKLNDPRLSPMIYVSEVNVTPDFKYCKVKISYDSDDQKELDETIKILQKSEGFIKNELAHSLKMPSIPKLIFELDKGTKAELRINEILNSLNIPKDDDGDNNEW